MPGGPGSNSQVDPDRACWSCGAEGGATLLRCKGCQTAFYCGKECQRADWKEHKPLCRAVGASTSPGASATGTNTTAGRSRGTDPARVLSSLFGGGGPWYEGLQQNEVYERFIDSFRLRRDDDYNFAGDVCEFYGGGDPMPDFEEFLRLAKERQVLPSWWNKEHDRKLKRTAMTDPWANINYAVEKSDIQEHYDNPMEPMALRMVAEQVYGRNANPW